MTDKTSFIGKSYPPQSLILSPERARAYAAATDDHNPRYGGADGLAPPMALVTATIPQGVGQVARDEALIGDMTRLLRLLHMEEDIRWHAPLRVGDTLQTRPTLTSVQEKTSGEILVVQTAVYNQHGAHLADTSSHLFIRHKKVAPRREEPARPAEAELPAAAPAHHPALAWTPQFTETWRVAADQSERYAHASGDHNPIHLEDAAAQEGGLKARILHGLCSMAFAQRALIGQCAGGDAMALTRLKVRFSRPVYMGEELTWLAHETGQQEGRRRFEFVVENGEGHAVLSQGIAELRA